MACVEPAGCRKMRSHLSQLIKLSRFGDRVDHESEALSPALVACSQCRLSIVTDRAVAVDV